MCEMLKVIDRLHITELEVKVLKRFSKKIFNPYEGIQLNKLVNSIKHHGVINPIIVRQSSQGYEVLCGDNRVVAAKIAGLSQIPAYNLGYVDDATAIKIVEESDDFCRHIIKRIYEEKHYCC